jgi:hypothetical protein
MSLVFLYYVVAEWIADRIVSLVTVARRLRERR